MTEQERVLILLPTYNERENLALVLDAIFAHQPSFHVCVVDDNSPDGTAEIARARAAADSRVHLLSRAGKEGLGRAYIAGFRWGLTQSAQYTHFCEMDADLSHDPRYLGDLLNACRAGADVAIGSRYVPGGGIRGWGPHRLALSWGGSLYARLVLGVGLRDLTAGFQMFRRAALEALPLDDVLTVGYGFQIEMKVRMLALGFHLTEVPIIFPDRERGDSKMSLKIAGEAAGVVWKLRRLLHARS